MLTDGEKLLLRKVLLEWCRHCGNPCGNENNFCSFCGAKNRNFDEAELIREEGFPPAAELARCRAGHYPTPHLLNIQYCSYCGRQLMILWSGKGYQKGSGDRRR